MTDIVGTVEAALSAASAAAGAGAAVSGALGMLGGGGTKNYSVAQLGLEVKVNDTPLSTALTHAIMRIDVESHLNLPDSIVVAINDNSRSAIEDGGFELNSPISVAASYGDGSNDSPTTLSSGVITSLEIETDHNGCTTVIRGLDTSNLLFRGRKTLAFQEMTASDIVEQIAGNAGLTPNTDPTDATYTVATQANQSDWEFIQQLAKENNRIVYCSQGTLNFVEPIDASTAPPPGDNTTPPIDGQLVLGVNLTRVNMAVTAAEQVSSVEVRGWDPSQKQAIVGEGDPGTVSASNDDSPDEIAGMFGGETFVYTEIPYSDQGSADAAAAALAERLGSAFYEVDGETSGSPWLMAGTPVSIAGCGDPFDGSYVVTSARHIYDVNGYRTEFTCSGQRDTTLPGLTTSAWQQRKRHLISGVVTATISSVQDPTNSGLVQLTFPWLDDEYVSDWCRVVMPGAGSAWGNILLPETNSEVLVAFEQGDIRKPYVIGGLYNGQDTIAPQTDTSLVDSGTGAVNQRLYQSRTKHLLYFNDSASAGAVLLQSGDTNHMLKFDQSGSGTITLQSNGDITIQGNNVTITAQQNLQMQGQSQLSLSSPQVTVSADSTLAITSNGTASLTASATLSISGSMTSINS